MKHLLYLDRDFLYSYYAQAFDGLEGSRQTERLDQTQTSQSKTSANVKSGVGFELKVPTFLSIKTDREDTDEQLQSAFLETEAVREAITVSLHDNALNRVIEHCNPTTDDNFSKGDYILRKGTLFLTDSKYLLDRLTDDLIDYIARKTWEERMKKLPNPGAPEVQKGKKAFIDNEKNKLCNSKNAIESMSKIAQFELFLLIDNIIVPLKREFMREDSREIIFKYDTDVTVFGQVTRINDPSAIPDKQNSLAVLNRIFNNVWPEMLENMGVLANKNNYVVVSPMAIFFE